MPKYTVMFARFPYGRRDEPDTTDWLVRTVHQCKNDPRINDVLYVRLDDTPITMTRNRAVELAKTNRADYLVMLDNDMKPDAYHISNISRLGLDPRAKPFWETSFEFLLQHNGPAAVASPYCGPPPNENVYIFRWASFESGHPNKDHHLEQYSREEAFQMGGIGRVDALPTGLIVYDMRCFERTDPPYFYYEWKDKTESEKASTEDCAQTRDLTYAGVPVYCNWDAWSGHWKWKCVGKPDLVTVEMVSKRHEEAIRKRLSIREQLIMVNDGHGNGLPMPRLETRPRFPGPEEAEIHPEKMS